jgi:CHAT domain-containing protein
VLVGVLVASLASAASAAPDLAACDAGILSAPDSLDAHLCFHVVSRNGDPAPALRRIEALGAIRPSDPRIELARGLIHLDRSSGRAALAPLQQAAAGFEKHADREGQLHAVLALTELHGRHGDWTAARERVRAARATNEPADPLWSARIDNREGRVALLRGDYAAAETLLARAETTLPADAPPKDRARLWLDWGEVAIDTARHGLAVTRLERAVELYVDAGDAFGESEARYQLARATGLNHVAQSMEEYRARIGESMDAARRSADEEIQAHLYVLHADDFEIDARERIARLERAERVFERLGLPADRAEARLRRAELIRRLDPRNPDEAYALRDEAIELARRTGSPWYVLRGLISRSDSYWNQGRLERAIEDGLEVLEIYESFRDLQRDDLVHAVVTDSGSTQFHRLSGRVLRRRDEIGRERALELAFRIMERLRARTLVARLDLAGATSNIADDTALQRDRNRLLDRIAGLQRRLLTAGLGESERAEMLDELKRREAEERALRNEIGRNHPAFERLRPSRMATIAEVRDALHDDEAMLAFQIAQGRTTGPWSVDLGGSWCTIVGRDVVDAVPLPNPREIDDAVRILSGLEHDAARRTAESGLYDMLLREALDRLPENVTRLVVVAEGSLHELPFESLRAAPEQAPLVARYDWSYTPSATFWLRWRRATPLERPMDAVALADPPAPDASPGPLRGDGFLDVDRLGPLPFARREAKTLVRRLGGGSRLRAGPDASERWIKDGALDGFGIVHFATHALVDFDHPERSSILLAPGDEGEDGLLQIREVVDLKLDGALVVLSACESASGRVLTGEGPLGLARAFFQAGARTVVASLRPLRDNEAAQVIDGFYEHLAEGATVQAALAEAKRERVEAGAPPSAWSSLVVLGDGDLTPLPGGVVRAGVLGLRMPVLVGLALLLGLLGVTVVVLVRRSAG